jgi:hypothetical protein
VRLGDNCSSCHPRIQSPEFCFAFPCIAGEEVKESFYSTRKFGRRASEQSSNLESGLPGRAPGEHVSTLQGVDHGGWSKSSIDGESAERASVCSANGFRVRSTESTSAGGDEGVCAKQSENGVSAEVRSSRSTESESTCGVRGVESRRKQPMERRGRHQEATASGASASRLVESCWVTTATGAIAGAAPETRASRSVEGCWVTTPRERLQEERRRRGRPGRTRAAG